MMAMEESAKSLARDMVLQPQTPTLGALDPAFVALHRQHMKDETRHVHIDAHADRAAAWMTSAAHAERAPVHGDAGRRGAADPRRLRREGDPPAVRDMPALAPREAELIDAVSGTARTNGVFKRACSTAASCRSPSNCSIARRNSANLGKTMVGYDRRTPASSGLTASPLALNDLPLAACRHRAWRWRLLRSPRLRARLACLALWIYLLPPVVCRITLAAFGRPPAARTCRHAATTASGGS